MKRLAALVLALAALALPGTAHALPKGTHVQVYKGGLNQIVDMAYVPGTKKIFFTEKDTGKIRVLRRGKLLSQACVHLKVVSDGERGALGLALDPHFERNHYLYVYFTKRHPLENRVTRFTVDHNRCVHSHPLITGIPTIAGYHNGGQLYFLGGKLFVTVGEGHTAGNAQNLHTRLGKILRYNRDGSIPRDNPVLGGRRTAIWSYGHRNGFGLTSKPNTKMLYETENGPNCDDELNWIRKGHNYGWGDGYVCGTGGVGPHPVAPLKRWSSVIAPTDPWWYTGKIARMRGSIYMGDYDTGSLRRIRLTSSGKKVARITVIHHAPSGIIDVSDGPGGWLYFSTATAIYRIVN